MQNKKILAVVLLVLFVIGGGTLTSLIFSGNPNSNLENTTTTLNNEELSVEIENNETVDSKEALVFYSRSCPHCDVLKDYLNENNEQIDLNIKLLKVDDPKTDKANIALVLEKVKECNIGER